MDSGRPRQKWTYAAKGAERRQRGRAIPRITATIREERCARRFREKATSELLFFQSEQACDLVVGSFWFGRDSSDARLTEHFRGTFPA